MFRTSTCFINGCTVHIQYTVYTIYQLLVSVSARYSMSRSRSRQDTVCLGLGKTCLGLGLGHLGSRDLLVSNIETWKNTFSFLYCFLSYTLIFYYGKNVLCGVRGCRHSHRISLLTHCTSKVLSSSQLRGSYQRWLLASFWLHIVIWQVYRVSTIWHSQLFIYSNISSRSSTVLLSSASRTTRIRTKEIICLYQIAMLFSFHYWWKLSNGLWS